MKIILQKKKWLVWLCAVFVIIFIGFMVLIFHVQRQNFSKTNKESLQVLADEKALLVNTFLESQKEKLEIIVSMNVFKEALLYPNDPAKIATAKDKINQLKNNLPGIGIINKKGFIVVAENNPAGTDYSMMPMFPVDDKTGITFMRYYDSQRKKDYFGVIGPIYDGTEKNKVIGVIGFDIELEKISALMKEALKGKTNEVYLIDETGLLLSGSKYIGKDNKGSVLIQEVKSNGANECLADLKKYQKDGAIEEHKDEVSQYINYMGDEVFGAIAHVPSIMGCVIAEEGVQKVLGIYDVKLY